MRVSGKNELNFVKERSTLGVCTSSTNDETEKRHIMHMHGD